MPTRKQKLQLDTLRQLAPMAPLSDFAPVLEAMRAPHMKNLDVRAAAWLALVAHIRHVHTDYDQLRDEGYDHESARFFVLDAINETLAYWASPRRLSGEEDAEVQD